ncbi:DUF6968 family protein [Methylobacterium nigriterrae]|uniref:DUF6968 family protein n=1 Tax=Methylobacterium nigriterrae TaxID=3127512 RepID=UPI0030140506
MIIAERIIYFLESNAKKAISIKISIPESDGSSWVCHYEIDWPDHPRKSFAAGIDSVQALHLALQKIGIDIYMSKYHQTGNLYWESPNNGYGFPIPKDGCDLLVGTDNVFEG